MVQKFFQKLPFTVSRKLETILPGPHLFLTALILFQSRTEAARPAASTPKKERRDILRFNMVFLLQCRPHRTLVHSGSALALQAV
jgi:hypothetical protein